MANIMPLSYPFSKKDVWKMCKEHDTRFSPKWSSWYTPMQTIFRYNIVWDCRHIDSWWSPTYATLLLRQFQVCLVLANILAINPSTIRFLSRSCEFRESLAIIPHFKNNWECLNANILTFVVKTLHASPSI